MRPNGFTYELLDMSRNQSSSAKKISDGESAQRDILYLVPSHNKNSTNQQRKKKPMLSEITKYFTGPNGGIAAIGYMLGVVSYHIFAAPKIYGAKVEALESRIALLEGELEPWREFKENRAKSFLGQNTTQ